MDYALDYKLPFFSAIFNAMVLYFSISNLSMKHLEYIRTALFNWEFTYFNLRYEFNFFAASDCPGLWFDNHCTVHIKEMAC